MGLKIMGFNGAKLNFMFENFPINNFHENNLDFLVPS